MGLIYLIFETAPALIGRIPAKMCTQTNSMGSISLYFKIAPTFTGRSSVKKVKTNPLSGLKWIKSPKHTQIMTKKTNTKFTHLDKPQFV